MRDETPATAVAGSYEKGAGIAALGGLHAQGTDVESFRRLQAGYAQVYVADHR